MKLIRNNFIYLRNNIDQLFSAIRHRRVSVEQYEHSAYLDHLNYMSTTNTLLNITQKYVFNFRYLITTSVRTFS